jgi:ferritin
MLDKNVLLSTSLSDKISDIGNLFFNYNRILDAGMDYLDIDYNMTQMSKYIHENIAHKAPIDADVYRDFNARNSRRTNYGVDILGNDANYESPLEFFAFALAYSAKIMNEIYSAIDMAMDERNHEVSQFLKSQIPVVSEYKSQFILLYEKCEANIKEGNTWQDIDHRWEDFALMGG